MPRLTTPEKILILKARPKILDKLTQALTPEEIRVLKEKYQLREEKSWKEVGESIGTSGTWASKVAKKALRKLHQQPARSIILTEYDLKISIRNKDS